MNSKAPGRDILAVEVTNISSHGIWLLVGERELFMPHADFPWFRNAPVKAIFNVVQPSRDHFHWPDLDVDLTTEIIEHPERFPLKSR